MFLRGPSRGLSWISPSLPASGRRVCVDHSHCVSPARFSWVWNRHHNCPSWAAPYVCLTAPQFHNYLKQHRLPPSPEPPPPVFPTPRGQRSRVARRQKSPCCSSSLFPLHLHPSFIHAPIASLLSSPLCLPPPACVSCGLSWPRPPHLPLVWFTAEPRLDSCSFLSFYFPLKACMTEPQGLITWPSLPHILLLHLVASLCFPEPK